MMPLEYGKGEGLVTPLDFVRVELREVNGE